MPRDHRGRKSIWKKVPITPRGENREDSKNVGVGCADEGCPGWKGTWGGDREGVREFKQGDRVMGARTYLLNTGDNLHRGRGRLPPVGGKGGISGIRVS